MSILSIRHLTKYSYRKPVSLGEHRMMFRPLESYDQRVVSAELIITPQPSDLRNVHDVFGNCVGFARFAAPARELIFENNIVLVQSPLPAFIYADQDDESYVDGDRFAYSDEDHHDLSRSIEMLHPDPDGLLERWARGFLHPNRRTPLRVLLTEMTQAIHTDFSYATRLHGPAQSPLQTLRMRVGTCRDFAVLMMEAVRSLGLAAQFVSGYIHTPQPDDARGRRGGGHTHAWVRVYVPACGWLEFDPTNGIVGNADLIRVAIARDPRQALPLSGTWFGAAGDFLGMEVEVDVAYVLDERAPQQRQKSDRLHTQHNDRKDVVLTG